jgi:hypothetical protein
METQESLMPNYEPDPDDLEEALGCIYFEVVAPSAPGRPQLLACSRCGADVTGGKKHRDKHEKFHDLIDRLLELAAGD